MIRRPQPTESDEDLIKQDQEFHQSNQLKKSVKFINTGKRKSEEASDLKNESVNSSQKTKSRFAEKRLEKKKKEGIVDNTILQEIVSKRLDKVSVISSVVERNVPSVLPGMHKWMPIPSPQGFPQAPKINLSNISNNANKEKKSLYMQQMENEIVKNESRKPTSTGLVTEEHLLNDLGSGSFIVNLDAERIHQDNLSLLRNLSHEDRIRERNELMSRLSKQEIEFIQSLRTKKCSTRTDTMEVDNTSCSANNAMAADDTDSEQVSFLDKNETVTIDEEMTEDTTTEEKVFKDVLVEPPLELPISLSEAQKWLHMDKVELDKLKWMTKVPKLKPLKNGEGFVARFNFDGDLLPYNADISWREGLHHHGEEPERAGYTLDELFILVRSNVVQQRHLGLKTIANVLRNAKEGLYDVCFQHSIIQLMVDAGLVLLLRFAIDETTALVYQEALRALYHLISSEGDEKCLEAVETWYPYDSHPGISSRTHAEEKTRKELDTEEKELKDVEVIQLDIIRALVRMDVLVRLRYFLESVTLLPPDVIHILGILKRISRHSLTAASTIVKTQRLLKTIYEKFLPSNCTPLLQDYNTRKVTSVYGIPLRHALQLFKVLAARSRHIASSLINDYDIMTRILAYVYTQPDDGQLPLEEALLLTKEAYSLWSVFMAYGLKKAQLSYTNFYPYVTKQLLFYRDKVDLNMNIESNEFNYDIGAHLMNVITKALNVAAHKTMLYIRMKRNEPSITTTSGDEQILQPPVIDWEEFDQIFELVKICISKWVVQLSSNGDCSFAGKKLLGSFMHFVNIYLSKWKDQNNFEGVKFINTIQSIFKSIKALLEPSFLDKLLDNLSKRSCLVSHAQIGSKRDPQNLGSLSCICHGGQSIPILLPGSPFIILKHLTNLMKTLINHNPSSDVVTAETLLDNDKLISYFRDVVASKHSLRGQWMNRIEVHCITDILLMASINGCKEPVLFHKVAFTLLLEIQNGDECLIKSLLEDVICNPAFWTDLSSLESRIDTLSVCEMKPLKSAAFAQPLISIVDLTKTSLDNLLIVGKDLTRNLMHSKSLENSRIRANDITFLVNSLTLDQEEESIILDPFWTLTPLKMMSLVPNDKSDPDRVLSVVRWLQMSFLLIRWRSMNTDPTGWIRHLSLVFLVSSDLFLDVRVNSYTQACLKALLQNENSFNLKCTNTYSGLPKCFDWYKELIDQFGAVSYGDSTFALFVVIPLQKYWPETYRELLFGDKSDILPFIRLSVEDVNQFVPIEQFLEPKEEDKNLIIKYRSALGSGLVNSKRNSFLFHFASHHVKHFLNKQNF